MSRTVSRDVCDVKLCWQLAGLGGCEERERDQRLSRGGRAELPACYGGGPGGH